VTIARNVSNLTFVDAAFMLDPLPDADGYAFYIGGDTPHVYTLPEVVSLKAKYRYLLPIFVRSNPPGPGAASDVVAAVIRLRTIGAPAGCLVALDSETSIDAAYVRAFFAGLKLAGYVLIDYGSQAFVMGNKNPDGYYWGADWTDRPHLHSGDVMTQYVSFQADDVSLASSALPFWDTHAGPVPDPPPAVPGWQEAMVNALPVLQSGSKDVAGQILFVHRVQVLVNGIANWNGLIWGNPAATMLTVDGNFGLLTTEAVQVVQGFFSLTQDGIVGPLTWAALIAG
jgi:peptidoglycan hydrolase-like protein with peptidoglycan-binding domain